MEDNPPDVNWCITCESVVLPPVEEVSDPGSSILPDVRDPEERRDLLLGFIRNHGVMQGWHSTHRLAQASLAQVKNTGLKMLEEILEIFELSQEEVELRKAWTKDEAEFKLQNSFEDYFEDTFFKMEQGLVSIKSIISEAKVIGQDIRSCQDLHNSYDMLGKLMVIQMVLLFHREQQLRCLPITPESTPHVSWEEESNRPARLDNTTALLNDSSTAMWRSSLVVALLATLLVLLAYTSTCEERADHEINNIRSEFERLKEMVSHMEDKLKLL